MFIVVASQQAAAAAYVSEFIGEGVPSVGMFSDDYNSWLDDPSKANLDQARGFLIEESSERIAFAQTLRKRTPAPIIAFSESRSLERTLELLTAGIDDVVRRPIHVKEILARSEAIWRRHRESQPAASNDRLRVYFNGQDAEVDGQPLTLPRRELNILEYFVRNRGRSVSKAQVFHAVYQDCQADVSETVVEGHISKLRKKLRMRMGYDPIMAKRFEGYTYIG
ncbi:response regulator transcription factor [Microvirga lotononidis]|uniref:Response regulator with CheY-like receiver domain and winged-helix DNA-binding domain n=1 Tax=Microvirga lotononidis TaxID=864069 RepID=I4YXB5_9HYPH|nr:response regulator transcription factor [Microvirga lotononidis]EIM28607.1 response regulator with CheY-like receiver domain and winged-helix DNA-binding domain [Microvirga lotononidis]WQO30402.1 response regulator transcription factor [Microvirga lotononidis]